MTIMDRPRPGKFSYQDYLKWDNDSRREIIDGEAFSMSPGARPAHQRLVTKIWSAMAGSLSGSKCEAFVAPIDVKLSENDVVQPDIIVVCDAARITDTHIDGPPTLVAEVLSPSSIRHDRVRKLDLYSKFGISEYWIVTPEPAMVELFTLGSDGFYRVVGTYMDSGRVTSAVLPQVTIELSDIFGPPQDYPDEVRECVSPG